MSDSRKCSCGCDRNAEWLIKSYDYDPQQPDGMGRYFEEYCCDSAKQYLIESIHDFGFPYEFEHI